MTIANSDIKETAKKQGVYLWRIAEHLGVSDCSFSKKLRRELPQEEKDKIFRIIQELKGAK